MRYIIDFIGGIAAVGSWFLGNQKRDSQDYIGMVSRNGKNPQDLNCLNGSSLTGACANYL
jgi:hypothetical protein